MTTPAKWRKLYFCGQWPLTMAGLEHGQSSNTFGCHPVRYRAQLGSPSGTRYTVGAAIGRPLFYRHVNKISPPRGGGKFLLSAVYALCFSDCVSIPFAVPHPTWLTPCHLPPGGRFFAARTKPSGCRAAAIPDAPAHEMSAATGRRYRAGAGQERTPPHRRTHWPPALRVKK